MLSGKNKQRFEANYKPIILGDSDFSIIINLEEFYKLPPEMQKGVYEKYFDSLGYYIDVKPFETKDDWIFQVLCEDIMSPFFIYLQSDADKPFKSRDEAFTEAVKQLDKLINDEL